MLNHAMHGHGRPEPSATTALDAVSCKDCARSSTDRASDYGSEGWGFESLRARQVRGPLPHPGRAFLSLLGATGTHQRPNSVRLIDSAAARLSPSSRCPPVYVLGDGDAGVTEYLRNHVQRRALGQH